MKYQTIGQICDHDYVRIGLTFLIKNEIWHVIGEKINVNGK